MARSLVSDDCFLHVPNESANSAQRPTLSHVERACTLSAEYHALVILQPLR
jgi:hypothetical protein